jgi:hypothetical protein
MEEIAMSAVSVACNSMGILRSFLIGVSFVIAVSVLGIEQTRAQIVGEAERNVSRMENYQNECAIAINPVNKNELFAACNNSTGGIFFARSTDRGQTWIYPDADKTFADGDSGQGALACCDPSLAWDSFGNLFITYLGNVGSVETLLSTDGGQTFTGLASFAGSVDQPTVVAENTSAAGAPVAVWVVWNQSGQMRARGAAVTGLGTVGAFGPMQTIPGTSNCSFGDVAIAPTGVVVQACQTPTGGEGPGKILVNIDADGLGPGDFGTAITATTTNVGGFDFIPAQSVRSIDAEASLAFDRNPASPHFGRLYLGYTDEVVNEGNDTDILLRFSDNNGQNWSAPIRVNDDPAGRSQFLPKIATNPLSGNIAVCWHDARNSAGNDQMQEFCSVATPTPSVPAFFPNVQVGAGTSTGTGSNPPVAGQADIQYGDYSGLDYYEGRAHPIWADQSNTTGDNPDGTLRWEAESNRASGGPMANEGDPHLATVDGVHYDFQAAGEFTVIRSTDGFEVQTRQTAIPTTVFPGPNAYTGLSTCVSLNSAVAARVGTHRVTFQPKLDGQPDPSGMELRVDGILTALVDKGVKLPGGGRVIRSAVGGMEVEFPNGALLMATPAFWSSQGKWYLNVNITGAEAFEGIMGAVAPKSWLPTLRDGSSLGPKPASLAERYDLLYRKFASAWRVSKSTSLFDYAPSSSTDDFTVADWPKSSPPCDLPGQRPAQPAEDAVANQACRALVDDNRRQNCIFDVKVTGEEGFAKTYLATERLERWGTTTILATESRPEQGSKPIGFVATVAPRWAPNKEVLSGAIQFYLHDKPVDEPVQLDGNGRAVWIPNDFDWQNYRVTARYVPKDEKSFLRSVSNELANPDRGNIQVYQAK